MKTKILLIGFFLLSTFSFGQQQTWGNWVSDKCYSYIQFQMKVTGVLKANGNVNSCSENETSYSIKVKNTSDKKAKVMFNIYSNNSRQNWKCEQGQVKLVKPAIGVEMYNINPNETINLTRSYIRGGELLFFEVAAIQFYTNDGKINKCYEKCGNGSICYECQDNPNQTPCCNSTAVSEHDRIYGTNSNNQNTAQNNQQAEQQRIQQENQRIAQENAQRAEEERQRKLQAKQELINISVNGATDLINYFGNRKKALRSALTQEDGQALIGIVNSENPYDYIQNIVDIFSDLGYTHISTVQNSDHRYIYFKGNDAFEYPLSISIYPANKYAYSTMSFHSAKKEKLISQLWVIKDDLVGWTIKGISPSRQKIEDEKKLIEEQKKLEDKQKKNDVAIKMAEFKPIKSERKADKTVTVKSVIDKHINAIGGEEKLKAVKNIYQHIEYENMKYGKGWVKSICIYGKFVHNGMHDGSLSKTVFNGSTAYSTWNGKKNILDNETILLYKEQNKELFPILLLQKNSDLTLGDVENFKGKDCYTIIENSKFKNLAFVRKHLFDMDSGLWIGTEQLATTTNYNFTSYTYYDDYRKVDNILFPFDITNVNENSYQNDFIKEIKLNQPLTDEDFE